VSENSHRIARLMGPDCAGGVDPYYLGYFDQFNRGLFFDAHEVLEHLWLKSRNGPNGSFYKGLIQLAGAFVHLRRDRPRPAAALFKLADANLRKYPDRHEHLAVPAVLALIRHWQGRLDQPSPAANALQCEPPPALHLEI
jgi:hypothetical protein